MAAAARLIANGKKKNCIENTQADLDENQRWC
jgi:hypothetical protein